MSFNGLISGPYIYNRALSAAEVVSLFEAGTHTAISTTGLLLAPDAGQAGGGLTWYDTSGNAANITLPASGVAWSVPSSQKTASGWTFGGNLTVSGTGTSSFASRLFGINTTSPDDIGAAYSTLQLNAWATGGGAYAIYKNVADSVNFRVGADGQGVLNVVSNHPLLFATFNAERARITASGNLLVGTTTDGGQKLQVAGGIAATGLVDVTGPDNSGANGVGNLKVYAANRTALMTFNYQNINASGALLLSTAGTTALTLDSSQNFKLTPAVVSSIITTQSAPQIRMGSRASGRSNIVLDSTAGRVWSFENTGTSLTIGYSGLDAVTIAETTGDATFAGKITANGAGSTFKGTNTNDSAAAGYVGEYVSSTVASASKISLSTDTPANVTSISLTAGDWDVSGAAAFVGSGLTGQYIVCAIGTVSASISSNGYPQQGFTSAMPTNNSDSNVPVNFVRISVASTTTVYLVAQAGFSAGTCSAYGFIRARRVR